MTHRVRFSRTAQEDLFQIARWIGDRSGRDAARDYLARIEADCAALADYPLRGTPRDEFGPGVRSIAFERRATVFYGVSHGEVTVLHIAHSGRDPERLFGADPDSR